MVELNYDENMLGKALEGTGIAGLMATLRKELVGKRYLPKEDAPHIEDMMKVFLTYGLNSWMHVAAIGLYQGNLVCANTTGISYSHAPGVNPQNRCIGVLLEDVDSGDQAWVRSNGKVLVRTAASEIFTGGTDLWMGNWGRPVDVLPVADTVQYIGQALGDDEATTLHEVALNIGAPVDAII